MSPPPNGHTTVLRTKSIRAAFDSECTTPYLTMTPANLSHELHTDQMDTRFVAGHYRLLALIGRGRLGQIYEADDDEHRNLAVERRVAIQLLPDRITQDRALFDRLKLGYTELQSAPHPNIVPFLGFDHDGQIGYLVTDFLEGASLRVILDDCTTLPLDEVTPVIRAVGDALQFLHAKSIVHGRLTAKNVFVTENLQVRLLDVVPLDTANSILVDVASGDPLAWCDIAGDIYDLACLTYEMLAGKHPFNFHALADAHHAGLKPTRIESLPEKQWNALRHALSFDSEQRTPAVADFLREFGVKGTERLVPTQDATAEHESSSIRPANEVPPTTHSTGSSGVSPVAAAVSPAARTVPVVQREDGLDVARTKGKRGRRWVSAVLAIVLVGLGGWYFYGQPRDDIAWLTNYLDSSLGGTSAGTGNGDLPVEAIDIAPATTSNSESANIPPDLATQADAENDARAESPGGSLAGEDAASGEVTAHATEEATTESADERLAITGTVARQSNDDAATEQLARTSDIDRSSQSEPQYALIQSAVYVSESDGAARIASPLSGNATGRIFWWTADYTAIAENDYIPTEKPREGFASGEDTETLYIPLVDDSIPEPPETFYVYLGRHSTQLGQLKTIARIRVEISDAD